MYLKLINSLAQKKPRNIEEGFSLIEVTVAMVTLGICLAYAMPLFLYAKLNNARSEIRTGALIVAQRVFDKVRSQPFGELPVSDGSPLTPNPYGVGPNVLGNLVGCTDFPSLKGCLNNTSSANPVITPNVKNVNLKPGDTNYGSPGYVISSQEKLLTNAIGRQYQTKVTFCEGITGDATVCNSKYRTFKVEVSFNGSPVYNVQGTYTDFQ